MRNFYSVFVVAAVLLVPSVTASIGDIELTVDSLEGIYNRCDLSVDISKDDQLTVIFPTSATKTDSLAATGPKSDVKLTLENGYGRFRLHNKGIISEIQLGEWDVKGTLALDKDLTARILGAVWWDFDPSYTSDGEVRKLQPFAEISGPTTSPYTAHFNNMSHSR